MKILITFKTSTAATKAQWLASEEGISCKLIPTPERLGVKCGYSLCADVELKEKIAKFLGENNIEYSEMHEYEP